MSESSIDSKSTATELCISKQFAGRFQIIRRLRDDMAGELYEVEDTLPDAMDGRHRMLRVLPLRMSRSESILDTLREQAQHHAQIDSSCILRILDVGIDPGTGMAFVVSEWAEGEDLDCILRQRDFVPFDDLLLLVGPMCEGLGAAHARGLWHGAFKPSNVLLSSKTKAEGGTQIKVAGLGLMAILASTQKESGPIGTPQWMAPEQTSSGQLGGIPADLWALGLVVFRMLTGSSYWRTAQVKPVRVMSIMREVTLEPLVPASIRARQYGCESRLPAGFDDWFERCVNRAPKNRFEDARQAFAVLSALADPSLTIAAPESPALSVPSGKQHLVPVVQFMAPAGHRRPIPSAWLWSAGFAFSALAFCAGYLMAEHSSRMLPSMAVAAPAAAAVFPARELPVAPPAIAPPSSHVLRKAVAASPAPLHHGVHPRSLCEDSKKSAPEQKPPPPTSPSAVPPTPRHLHVPLATPPSVPPTVPQSAPSPPYDPRRRLRPSPAPINGSDFKEV